VADGAAPPGERVVLVVEDEWLIRMEIADAFEHAGWTVLQAASGEEAVRFLANAAGVALLVTDIRLGGLITGWDVAERWRAARPTIGVIYASANTAISLRQVPNGVFMSKPTRIRELIAVGEALWREAVRRP
jgi:DNA-binding response OmpR family regulator